MAIQTIDAEIIFYREDGKEHIFVSNDPETLDKKVAELEFKGYKSDESNCMYKWRDGLYFRTKIGAPWAQFIIPIVEKEHP